MNVFEDLVLELKQENLLEQTVVDYDKAIENTDEPNREEPAENAPADETAAEPVDVEQVADETTAPQPAERAQKHKHGREFFNKRAIAEVSSLQMVEHVLTGIEREYLKIVPKTFDDFNAKKALNSFLQISDNSNIEENKRAEFDMMHETESWCSALAARDSNIPVSSLRQYCENSRPALSSQALLALGRFYRNSPYSEAVRAKFDFVITRLFSRAGEDDRRSCLFDREETIGHITTLYADWSSVPLYTADSDESNLLLTALSFEDLAAEAESASNFDQLTTNDFFGRLRLFKESISELFYAPTVTAVAIECNIRIGNAFVKLIEREHLKMDASSIQAKFGDVSDQTVSDAAGRTLDLAEIIRARAQNPVIEPARQAAGFNIAQERHQPTKAQKKAHTDDAKPAGKLASQFRSVNKWILIPSMAVVLFCIGLGIYVKYYTDDTVSSVGVRSVELEGQLGEHIKSARVSGDTFYVLLAPSWDMLSKEKRVEFLQKAFTVAQLHNCKQVNLVGKDGKVAAYADATRTDVVMP